MTSADRPLGNSPASPEQEHAVSSGIAAVSGGLAGAMIGQLVGGRLGAAIGAVVGGVAGATMGKEAGDAIHHTVEVSAQQVKNAAASISGANEAAEQAQAPTIDELYEQGLQLSNQGKLAEAIAAFQSVVAQEPEAAEAHYNLGIVLGKQGFRAEGIEQIEKARDLCRAQNRIREAENIDRILEKLNA